MSIDTAYNIDSRVGCDVCKKLQKCKRECPMLGLLVFLMAGGKCELFERETEHEQHVV